MSKKILVLDAFSDDHISQMNEAAGDGFVVGRLDGRDIREALLEASIVIGQPDMELIQNPAVNCPDLKLIQMTWAGTDKYTRSSLKFPEESISLCNASGAYGLVISQFVIGQILTLMLNFKTYHNQQQNKIWERRGPIKSLHNARVLIYGAGDIGTNTAKRLTGFDAYTIGVCRDKTKKREYFDELCTLEEAEKYLSDADVVVCCIPNSEQTEGYFDRTRLSLLKKNAIIVNVGRGNFIDLDSLNELIDKGLIYGAALDVTNPEPLPADHPLWENERVMITPHASGVAFDHLRATEDLLCKIACDNIRNLIEGKPLINRIY